MILKKRALLWFGWIIDSLEHGKQTRVEYTQKITAKVIKERIRWKDLMSKAQEEVECGPRTVCTIIHVVQQLTKNSNLEDIVRNTEEVSHISRTTPLKIVSRQICKHIMKYPNNILQLPVKIIESSQHDKN